jgi:hypothetical protein
MGLPLSFVASSYLVNGWYWTYSRQLYDPNDVTQYREPNPPQNSKKDRKRRRID